MREQHGHPATPVRGGLRLLRGADDFGQAKGTQAKHVRRVHSHLPALLRGSAYSHRGGSHQGDSRNLAALPELDPSGVHLRDTTEWPEPY